MGRLDVWTHPEAEIRVVSGGEAQFVFVGDVVPEGDYGADPLSARRLGAIAGSDDDALYGFLDTLAGRFALLMVEEGRVRVFHDPMGARSVFYHARKPFAVSSHALLLAECIGASRNRRIRHHRAQPGFRSRKTKGLPGDLTIFRDIYALIPNNLLDSSTMGTRRYWPRELRRPSTMSEFLARLDVSMGALATFAGRQNEPVIGLTGGVDSRVVIAALRKFGVGFETLTWRLTKLPVGEQAIIRQMAARLGAEHRCSDLGPGKQQVNRIARRNSGGYRRQNEGTPAAWEAYGNQPNKVFIRGYGGEVMRGFFNLEPVAMTTLEPSEMARLYWSPGGKPPPPGTVEFFERYYRRGNYASVQNFGYDPNDIFYWEHRMGMWGAAYQSEFDVAMRSIPAFNSRALFATALGLPAQQRLTKQLMLDATSHFDRRLADIPTVKMRTAKLLSEPVSPRRRRKRPRQKPAQSALNALLTKMRQIRRRLANLLA